LFFEIDQERLIKCMEPVAEDSPQWMPGSAC